ncbi:hypothetical protein CCHR01_12105 [Colletotrichum chrysophilum]|uniref:Chromo domain-containing protein n=1 Tax=Colletotrichum chrysophilum TaxID=1836956 RepID=A0AAD9EE32_9PEZI|nr:hypothetical protein CCHR01_12105 [Colletotrichum chrysophilum]
MHDNVWYSAPAKEIHVSSINGFLVGPGNKVWFKWTSACCLTQPLPEKYDQEVSPVFLYQLWRHEERRHGKSRSELVGSGDSRQVFNITAHRLSRSMDRYEASARPSAVEYFGRLQNIVEEDETHCQLQVHWVGYRPEESTWELFEHVYDICLHSVTQYSEIKGFQNVPPSLGLLQQAQGASNGIRFSGFQSKLSALEWLTTSPAISLAISIMAVIYL